MATFISYSWDSEEHTEWVRKLAERLTADGIEVNLDQWGLTLGQQLPQFMENSIRDNDYVLIICTPVYKKKSDYRKDGVGYEGNIISAELFYKKNYLKYIPVWRSGAWEEAAPSSILGSYYVNLRADNKNYENEYLKLRNVLRGIPAKPPILPTAPHKTAGWDDIKIYKVTEYLLGRALSGPYGILYTDGNIITESDIKDISNALIRYTRNGGWLKILDRADIDEIIDERLWKNGTTIYQYSRDERTEIMARCARSIKYRLEQYVGAGHIMYNIFRNGDIGFRYV